MPSSCQTYAGFVTSIIKIKANLKFPFTDQSSSIYISMLQQHISAENVAELNLKQLELGLSLAKHSTSAACQKGNMQPNPQPQPNI